MNYTKISEEEIKKELEKTLKPDRFVHSFGTAKCAAELAKKFGLNEEKAYVAGLLHDCAKCFSKEKLIEIINNKLEVDECELLNHKTFHAPVSAYIAQKDFGVEDEEILSAIRRHTLGSLNMTDFEKIIFLADKIEPETRDKEYATAVKKLLDEENGLNKALLMCYKSTIKSLVERELKICLLTVEIYNSLLTDVSG